MNSRPCVHCAENLRRAGIRRVYYSNDTGEIVWENVKEFTTVHMSRGWRNKIY